MPRPNLLKEEKPLTEESKIKLREAARLLANWLEKRDIQNHFDCTERHARDMISTLSKRIPIIAVSDRKGYKCARKVEDLELVRQSMAEIDSRIRELFARKEPLLEFIKKYGGEND